MNGALAVSAWVVLLRRQQWAGKMLGQLCLELLHLRHVVEGVRAPAVVSLGRALAMAPI